MNNNIVRFEKYGVLIWSVKYVKYFLLAYDDFSLLDTSENTLRKTDLVNELNSIGYLTSDKVIDNRSLDTFVPLEVYFDFTWLCNLANTCGNSFCYAKDVLSNKTLSITEINSIISQLTELGIMRVHLAGGEPTSKPVELQAYLSTTKKYGITTSLTTNGTLINDSVIDSILNNNVYSVTFSIDGYDEITNDCFRGKGVFAKAIKSIKSIITKRNLQEVKTKICLKPTFTPETPKFWFEKFIELSLIIGIDELKLNNPERCLFHETGYYGKSITEYYEIITFIKELSEKYQNVLKISNVNNPLLGCNDIGIPNKFGCIGGQELLCINADNSITPCAVHKQNLGNLNDFNSIKDFLTSSLALKDFRKSLTPNSDCKSCSLINKCRGGSLTRKIVETGNYIEDKDPLCPKDYLQIKNNEIVVKNRNDEFKVLKEISVAHSL